MELKSQTFDRMHCKLTNQLSCSCEFVCDKSLNVPVCGESKEEDKETDDTTTETGDDQPS